MILKVTLFCFKSIPYPEESRSVHTNKYFQKIRPWEIWKE